MISLDAKTRSMPQFIGAPQRNFLTTDLGIELSVPLALNGWVDPSDTLFLSMEILHYPCHPVPNSLQGGLSAYRGQFYEGHNFKLIRDINETLNSIGWSC